MRVSVCVTERERGKEGGREGKREGEREGGREGGRETSMVGSARIGSHVNECSLTCACVCLGGEGCYTCSLTIFVCLWLSSMCLS